MRATRRNVVGWGAAGMAWIGTVVAAIWLVLACVTTSAEAEGGGGSGAVDEPMSQNRLLKGAHDIDFVNRTIEKARQEVGRKISLTGIGVPHHLLAADLIARGVLAAEGGDYDQIVLISPDHYRALKTPFGVTTLDLDTVAGVLPASEAFARRLLESSSLFSDIGGVPREHGIHAVTPFVRSVFGGIPVVAITTATNSDVGDWRAAVAVLEKLITAHTLIIQSTDYSHFLPIEEAVLRDQETLGTLANGDPDAVLDLNQPSHMDSKASQFIQMALQRDVFHAAPIILGNRNAYEYEPGPGPTTSYVVTAYTRHPEIGSRLAYPDQTVVYFGGDVFVGRGWTRLAAQPDVVAKLADEVRTITDGHVLVVNLEGVVLTERPAGANETQHFMPADLAMSVLRSIGVTAVGIANNHAQDFGEDGLDESADLLRSGGFRVMKHGEPTNLGTVRILPLTFKRSYFEDHPVIRSIAGLQPFCALQGDSPLVAFVHWGGDYVGEAGVFENRVLDELSGCGVSVLLGAHSHQASTRVDIRSGGAVQSVFSMGNLMFDQTGANVSGSLVEGRVFRQGTVALRIIPIPNYFERFGIGR